MPRRAFAWLVAVAIGIAACERGRESVQRDSSGVAAQQGAPSATNLLTTGDALYGRGEYDSARVVWQRALPVAHASSDSAVEARILTNLGLASWRLAQYADARTFGERALTLKLSAGLTGELSKSYNALGLLARDEGRLGEAIPRYTKAVETARDVADSLAMAKAMGNRGLVHADLGDFATARGEIDVLRRIAHDSREPRLEANALNNLGMVEIRSGNPRGATSLLAEALRLYRADEYAVGEENALGQFGTAFSAMGDPQRAFAYLDSARVIAQREGLRHSETEDLQLIAELYNESGDHTRALQYLARAAALGDSIGLRKTTGDIARSQAQAYFALGRLDLAVARTSAARRLHAEAGARLDELQDDLIAAELAQRGGAPARAAADLAAARALATLLDLPLARAELAIGEARVADAANDAPAVLRALDRARQDLTHVDSDQEWRWHQLQARAFARLGRTADAIASGRAAIRAIERVRGNIASGTLRASYTADRSGVYADLVIALLTLGRTDEAFAVADAARGRALLEHIGAAGRGLQEGKAGVTADFAQAEQLLRRIDRLVERLRIVDTVPARRRSTVDEGEVGFLAGQLRQARHEYEELLQRTAGGARQPAVLLGGVLPDANSVRDALRPGEVLLEFYVMPTRLVTFVVSGSQVRALSIAINEDDLATRARLARELVAQRDAKDPALRTVLRGLYDILVAPVRREGLLRDVRSIVVVPHASLTYLPFAALVDSASGHYLVEDFDLLFAPSSASLPAVRASTPLAARGATVLAPFPSELPASRAEAIAVSRAVTGSSIYLGAQATELALRLALAQPRTVHVATHGAMNVRSPMFSRLELARINTEGAPPIDDDGRLEIHELLNLTIRSPLVFLSGCETGVGSAWSSSFQRGEDFATLAQAFLFAGARNVVATLWRIDDRGAAAFATAFYEQSRSRSPMEALGAAQRSMIRDREYASPFYWAAYTISGAGISTSAPQIRAAASVP